jgi:hypothetical protein
MSLIKTSNKVFLVERFHNRKLSNYIENNRQEAVKLIEPDLEQMIRILERNSFDTKFNY